jgi:ribosomal subunit interface protein
MRYQISGKQIDIGEALQTHVKAELGEVVEKYAQRPTEAVIVFSRVAHEHVCETTIHLATGLTAQARGHAAEIYAAFESCREKMDKQLRRYKRRLRNHHRDRAEPVEFAAGSAYRDCRDGDEDSFDHRRGGGHAAGTGRPAFSGVPQ